MSPTHDAMLRNLVMFGMMGALGIPVLFLTLILLVEICGVSPVLATSVGYLIGALVNYTLNYRFTFKSSKPHRDSGPKLFLIALMTGILNALLVYLRCKSDGHALPLGANIRDPYRVSIQLRAP